MDADMSLSISSGESKIMERLSLLLLLVAVAAVVVVVLVVLLVVVVVAGGEIKVKLDGV